FRARNWNSGAVDATSTTDPAQGVWYHVVHTWDSANGIRIFVNGVNEYSTAMPTYTASGASNYLHLAFDPSGCSGNVGWFDGSIDELRISNVSRSDDWINQSYQLIVNQDQFINTGDEQLNLKGAISANDGDTPFYTIDSNPVNSTYVSCLGDLDAGDGCNTTWAINATGNIDTLWEFFAMYDPLEYSAYYAGQSTSTINIRIVENNPPTVAEVLLLPALPPDYVDLNCSFVVTDSEYGNNLSVNITWYRDDAVFESNYISVIKDMENNDIMVSLNTSVNEEWFCSITPFDEFGAGATVNSTVRTIYDNAPPELNSVQCEVGGSWIDCSNLIFKSNFTAIRVNCTDDFTIENVTFSFFNEQDNNTYFSGIHNFSMTDYFTLDIDDIYLLDSGDFYLNVTCYDNSSLSDTSDLELFLPWGNLTASLVEPASDTNVQVNEFFEFTASVACNGGECGDANATLDPPTDYWNSDWGYRKAFNITETSGSSLTDFQVNLSINTTGLIAEGKMNSDCSDIRFADTSKIKLDYYIESDCNTSATVVWVKTDLTASSTRKIYMYYNNPSASSESSGDNVFEFFDDFLGSAINTTKWNVVDGSGWTVGSGNLSGTITTGRLQSATQYSAPIVLETETIAVTRAANGEQTAGFWTSTSDGFGILEHAGGTPTRYWYSDDGGWTGAYDFDTLANWHYIKISAGSSSNVNLIVRDLTDGSTNTHSDTNTISNERITLGRRYDNGNSGQAYQQYWDYMRVRKYASADPIMEAAGPEEIGNKGTVSTIPGTVPFYTTDDNPQYKAYQSCLSNLTDGKSCQATWQVNATGEIGTTWDFFVIFNTTQYPAYVGSDVTDTVQITIVDAAYVPPQVTLLSPDTDYATKYDSVNFTCEATDNIALKNLSLYLGKSSLIYNDSINYSGSAINVT
ncbi:MAG: DUF2341 domain-containing protein, partial [Nanoarchaeota archaeon]|nr:DUF2341 domain-containing protein [Nanoarchaeota archaeon]